MTEEKKQNPGQSKSEIETILAAMKKEDPASAGKKTPAEKKPQDPPAPGSPAAPLDNLKNILSKEDAAAAGKIGPANNEPAQPETSSAAPPDAPKKISVSAVPQIQSDKISAQKPAAEKAVTDSTPKCSEKDILASPAIKKLDEILKSFVK